MLFHILTHRNLDLLGPLGEAALSPVEATAVAALNLNVTGGHLKQIQNKDCTLGWSKGWGNVFCIFP